MSGIPTKRPPKAELQRRIDTGMSRQKMAETYDVHIATITKWFIHYGIANPGGYGKVQNVECGLATVVALITEEDEPEKYAIPGGAFCYTRDEALWAAAAMSILMGGKG